MRLKYYLPAFLGAALIAGVAVAAPPKGKVDIGKAEYTEKCAVCHGPEGRGNGGVGELLKKAPTDLTLLARKNGGVFPALRIYQVIDGREVIQAHGEREMPIWGNDYRAENTRAADYYVDMPYDMEMFVRARVTALMDYLYRIQSK